LKVAFSENDIAVHKRSLEIVGYTVVEEFLSNARATNARERVVALYESECHKSQGHHGQLRPNDRQVLNLQNKDKFFIDLVSDLRLESLLMPLLNDQYYSTIPNDAPNYILGELNARSSGEPLRLHLDSWMPAKGHYTWMVQVVLLLEDRGVDEGCTLVVPGSHLLGAYADRDFPTPIALPGKCGDLVIWDSRLWHGALKRISSEPGWVVIATMQRWWVKPRFDLTRAIPDEIFARLTDRQKALCGYCSVPPVDESEGTAGKRGYDAIDAARRAIYRSRE
jgi:ectoine hydroxylase-related dioxygenase (phytanoyl-CoA dioxygenase family)